MIELDRLRRGERWLAWIRLCAVPLAVLQTVLLGPYSPDHKAWIWTTTCVFAAGALLLVVVVHRELELAPLRRIGVAATLFDFAVCSSYILSTDYGSTTSVRQVMILVLIEAAFRWGMLGGVVLVAASAPVLAVRELLRERHLDTRYHYDSVAIQIAIEAVVALVVGWLVGSLRDFAFRAEVRAVEAESLRDELARRADILEAANRSARALASSLDIQSAFQAFVRELRGLLPFDRVEILVDEGAGTHTLAAWGVGGAGSVLGDASLTDGTIVQDVLRRGELVYRPDMVGSTDFREEPRLVELGLRARVVAPLIVAARPIGILSVHRREASSFESHELELVGLLGRLVSSTVQNIRAYEAERATAEELRRLSALRADFVSLVSHELRSPMAAVIGAARTLQRRWRELSAQQRESFLALIADETNRLAALIGDVLDTSRIEAGMFSYSFDDVDLADVVREMVASFAVGHEDVTVQTRLEPLPRIRADRERLKQVVLNLVDNAVKYSAEGGTVEVVAVARNGAVRIAVIDQGPGIPFDQQRLIFEKFGRVSVGGGKPGTGLGLFIARSIAEAHGGTLTVDSTPGRGATFTLELPV